MCLPGVINNLSLNVKTRGLITWGIQSYQGLCLTSTFVVASPRVVYEKSSLHSLLQISFYLHPIVSMAYYTTLQHVDLSDRLYISKQLTIINIIW